MRCCKASIAFVAFARVPEDAAAAFLGELEAGCVPLPFCAGFPEEALGGFFLFNEFMAILAVLPLFWPADPARRQVFLGHQP